LPEAGALHPELLIVPVTAFDRRGMRLGKGHGVYDRAIAAFRRSRRDPLLVGFAFSVQEVPAIPAEGHDVRLDWIVTETETLEFRPAR
jgi:5-formyltetrahydrofolate cyclo-ligase